MAYNPVLKFTVYVFFDNQIVIEFTSLKSSVVSDFFADFFFSFEFFDTGRIKKNAVRKWQGCIFLIESIYFRDMKSIQTKNDP